MKLNEIIKDKLYKVGRKLFSIGYDSDHEIVKELRFCIDNIKAINEEWIKEKPYFKDECVFMTATTYSRNNENIDWDYSVWQTKWIEGVNDNDEPAMYLGLLNGEGEEWGALEDLQADLYKIISAPKQVNS